MVTMHDEPRPRGADEQPFHTSLGKYQFCTDKASAPPGGNSPNPDSHGFPLVTRGYRRAILRAAGIERESSVEFACQRGLSKQTL